jgi:hypothetical protein
MRLPSSATRASLSLKRAGSNVIPISRPTPRLSKNPLSRLHRLLRLTKETLDLLRSVIAVVLPAASADLTSGQVISSNSTQRRA